MKRLRGKKLKQYFQDPARVTAWWRPEKGRYWFWHEQEFRILDQYLQADRSWKVFDAACGQGRFARYFAHKGCRVQGLDINKAMLDIAREAAQREHVLDRIEFIKGDVEKFLPRGLGFDTVLCMDSLDHMDNLNAAVGRLVRALRPGGTIVITYTPTESVYGLLRRIYTFFAYRHRSAEVDIARTYSFCEIREALFNEGIRTEHLFGIGLFTAPQERIRLPLFFNRVFEALSRFDIRLKPYYIDSWLARRCSGVMIIGRKVS